MQSDVNKRRAERQRKARKRHLMISFIVFLIIALITLVIMCFTVFFPVKRISVSESKIYTNAQIIKASGLTTKDNLFTISEKKIENNIRKALPYVDSIKLKRVLPDAVIITVTDAKEFAYYKTGDNYYILSSNGYILKQQKEMPDNVFEIVTGGIEGNVSEKAVYKNSTEAELVITLIQSLNKNKINIDKIDVTNSIQITLEVEGKFTVLLGSKDNLEDKIKHLSSMIDDITEQKGIINLSMWTPESRQGSFKATND